MDINTRTNPRNCWTVMRVEAFGKTEFRAFNAVTDEEKPLRNSYDLAFGDIPSGNKHNYAKRYM